MPNTEQQHSIRSFVLRQGRLTKAQQRAIDTLWDRFGITITPTTGILDLNELFQRRTTRILEIGFGNGDSLATMAENHPETDYLGIEVYRPGIGSLLLQAKHRQLTNLRIMHLDAKEALAYHLPDNAFNRIQLFFPDPWPKKRHRKRRLIQPDFANLAIRKLRWEGCLHLATDWQDYARHMQTVLEISRELINTAGPGGFSDRPDYRPMTRFEQRGQEQGHRVWDLIFIKKPLAPTVLPENPIN